MNNNQLKTVLKINGLSEASSDEEISAVLLHAKYSPQEVEAALQILRNELSGKVPRVDGLHRVFYSDDSLRPSEISGLLGVDVDISHPISRRSIHSRLTMLEVVVIVSISMTLAAIGLISYMYISDVGVFHPVLTRA